MKRALAALIALTIILGFVAAVMAEGNHRKGKYLFRNSCRACHVENATGGQQANVLEPSTYTMNEWTEAFTPEEIAGHPCKDEWEKLSSQDLADVYAYLYKFAKDSPTPAKCK
jgi:mono/diheme cytochrome c family protein